MRGRTLGAGVLAADLLGAAAGAEEALPADLALVRSCLTEAGGACIGEVSERCRSETWSGDTTQGIVACAGRETAAWDVLLNEEYRATRAWAEEVDRAEAVPEFAQAAQGLLSAQRAWIVFRDAECALTYAWWGSGSLRHVAAANCRMVMTAERTRALRAMREDGS